MFGYINPDSPYLFKKDEVLYKSLYCGLCKSIGRGCGQVSRTALTYDMSFVSALVHNIRGEDVKIEKKRCAVHWLKRRHVAQPDDTSVLLGCANTILAYYKLCDDKEDGEKRGIFRHVYKRGCRRAAKLHPEIERIAKAQLEAQRAVEKKNSEIIDEAAEPTAVMMQQLSDYALGEYKTPETGKLFYAIGKWVYLVDALDDYDKDVKKGSYNVFYNAYKSNCREEAARANEPELNFIFDELFAEMRQSLANITFHFNHDLTDNIILRGIPLKTRAVLRGGCGKKKGATDEQKES